MQTSFKKHSKRNLIKIPLIYQKILEAVKKEKITAKINVVFYKYSWEIKMKIIPMLTYIILENCSSQILCTLQVKKSYCSTSVQALKLKILSIRNKKFFF
jgi:hypothetical protein